MLFLAAGKMLGRRLWPEDDLFLWLVGQLMGVHKKARCVAVG